MHLAGGPHTAQTTTPAVGKEVLLTKAKRLWRVWDWLVCALQLGGGQGGKDHVRPQALTKMLSLKRALGAAQARP